LGKSKSIKEELMREEWWEKPACWLCDYWWVALLIIILGLLFYFLRPLWLTPLTLGTGDVQVTLSWHSKDDLDLWVYDPEGELINYYSSSSSSGGELDVDANAGCEENVRIRPVENIYWSEGEAPLGEYMVEVDYYMNCGTSRPINYKVRLKVDGNVTRYNGVLESEDDHNLVTSFTR